ncbi:thioredoxin family protein [Mariniflexile aquimaris]|uniref:Thioredoxin family protein n=1 Tax=Mariniflexile aquimaris TaxID=881009 RepID=A0ABW3BVA8_9FLAO
MKKIFVLFNFFLVISFNAQGQNWVTNFEEAKQLAAKNNQNIVLVFQGSDWCAPCIKLEREIWSTEEFKKLSKNHFVMLKADFPRKKANKLSDEQTLQNSKLAESYNKEGIFPLVVVLNKNGKVLGKTGYEKSNPTDYFKKLNSLEK